MGLLVTNPTASVTPRTTDLAADQGIDGLLYRKWDTTTLTYSFPTSAVFYDADPARAGLQYGDSAVSPGRNFMALSLAQQNAVRSAFALYSDVCGLAFTPRTETAGSHAVLRFGQSDRVNSVGTASGQFPGTAQGGDVWFTNKTASDLKYTDPKVGNYAFVTFLHEIGHTLGLKHGHVDRPVSYGPMPRAVDSMEFSVMTYRSYIGHDGSAYTNETGGYAQTLMMYDIAALQHMYGANYATCAGDTVYSWKPLNGAYSIDGQTQWTPIANRIFMTVWDGDGEDTYDFANYGTGVTVDLRPGKWTITAQNQLVDLDSTSTSASRIARGNIANALLHRDDPKDLVANTDSLIENATGGSGNDKLTGNNADNKLIGGIGADVLFGLHGNDTLNGGAGIDRFMGGEGVDTVDFSASLNKLIVDLTAGTAGGQGNNEQLSMIENVIGSRFADAIAGNGAQNKLAGGDAADLLSGLGGTDFLFGGAGGDKLIGGVGSDRLTGGLGKDTFYFNDFFDSQPGFVSFSGRTAFTFNIERFGNLSGSQTVSWAVQNGGDVDSTDFGGSPLPSGSVTFAPGESKQPITVLVMPDEMTEANEKFSVRIGGQPVSSIFNKGEAFGIIVDDDAGTGGIDSLRELIPDLPAFDKTLTFFDIVADLAVLSEGEGRKNDIVLDYSQAQGDIIDLSAIDANVGTLAEDPFHLIGTGTFTSQAGQLRYNGGGGISFIQGEITGDGLADFQLELTGNFTFTAANFIL